MKFNKKAQSTLEYATIAIVATMVIVIAGPMVIRSVNAMFKTMGDAQQESINDPLYDSTPPPDLPEKTCEWGTPQIAACDENICNGAPMNCGPGKHIQITRAKNHDPSCIICECVTTNKCCSSRPGSCDDCVAEDERMYHDSCTYWESNIAYTHEKNESCKKDTGCIYDCIGKEPMPEGYLFCNKVNGNSPVDDDLHLPERIDVRLVENCSDSNTYLNEYCEYTCADGYEMVFSNEEGKQPLECVIPNCAKPDYENFITAHFWGNDIPSTRREVLSQGISINGDNNENQIPAMMWENPFSGGDYTLYADLSARRTDSGETSSMGVLFVITDIVPDGYHNGGSEPYFSTGHRVRNGKFYVTGINTFGNDFAGNDAVTEHVVGIDVLPEASEDTFYHYEITVTGGTTATVSINGNVVKTISLPRGDRYFGIQAREARVTAKNIWICPDDSFLAGAYLNKESAACRACTQRGTEHCSGGAHPKFNQNQCCPCSSITQDAQFCRDQLCEDSSSDCLLSCDTVRKILPNKNGVIVGTSGRTQHDGMMLPAVLKANPFAGGNYTIEADITVVENYDTGMAGIILTKDVAYSMKPNGNKENGDYYDFLYTGPRIEYGDIFVSNRGIRPGGNYPKKAIRNTIECDIKGRLDRLASNIDGTTFDRPRVNMTHRYKVDVFQGKTASITVEDYHVATVNLLDEDNYYGFIADEDIVEINNISIEEQTTYPYFYKSSNNGCHPEGALANEDYIFTLQPTECYTEECSNEDGIKKYWNCPGTSCSSNRPLQCNENDSNNIYPIGRFEAPGNGEARYMKFSCDTTEEQFYFIQLTNTPGSCPDTDGEGPKTERIFPYVGDIPYEIIK